MPNGLPVRARYRWASFFASARMRKTESVVIATRFTVPVGAAHCWCADYLHAAPVFAIKVFGEESAVEVLARVAPSGAGACRDDVRGEGVGEQGIRR